MVGNATAHPRDLISLEYMYCIQRNKRDTVFGAVKSKRRKGKKVNKGKKAVEMRRTVGGKGQKGRGRRRKKEKAK